MNEWSDEPWSRMRTPFLMSSSLVCLVEIFLSRTERWTRSGPLSCLLAAAISSHRTLPKRCTTGTFLFLLRKHHCTRQHQISRHRWGTKPILSSCCKLTAAFSLKPFENRIIRIQSAQFTVSELILQLGLKSHRWIVKQIICNYLNIKCFLMSTYLSIWCFSLPYITVN